MYAYDAAGRLVGVSDPNGETARYRYDAAGNRMGIDRYATSSLSILSLVPLRAPVGATVTLSGTGFAATATSNTVKFGGATAEVVSATATRLTVKVPAGAEGGKVSVTVSGTTAQSAESFTRSSPAPSVSSMSPTDGQMGTAVVLTGANFATGLTDNVVRFAGGVVAEATARTDTTLTVKVPAGAVTGPMEIETADGRSASSTAFRVVSSSGDGDIESSKTTSVSDPAPPTVAVTTPGNRAQVLFDANQGDDINFGFTNSTFNSGVTLELHTPQGVRFGDSGYFNGNSAAWEMSRLPVGGRYVLILKPGTGNIGAVTVTVSKPVTGVLDPAGPTADVPITRAGQEARWTVNAALGTSLSIGVDASGVSQTANTYLYRPDGTEAASGYLQANRSGSLGALVVSASGQYTVRYAPNLAATGTVRLTASRFADAGTLDPTGPPGQLRITRPGQSGVARFDGQAGQRISLGLTPTGFSSYIEGEVRAPDGKVVSGSAFTLWSGSSHDWDSPPLPATGTYSVVIDPPNIDVGTVALTASRPLALGALTTTAAPTRADISRMGQNAEAAFTASAGDNLALGVSANTMLSGTNISVFAPSGAIVVDRKYVSAGDNAGIPLAGISETGAYRVLLNPVDGATGAMSLTLSADLAFTVSAQGASVPLSMARAGQTARGQFTASAGDDLSLGVTGNTFTATTYVTVFAPSGAKVVDAQYLFGATSGSVRMPDLPQSGIYTVLIYPSYGSTGSLNVTLAADVRATLSASGASVPFPLTRPGQRAQGQFTAVAGDDLSIGVTGNTFTGNTYVTVLAPSGAKLINAKYIPARYGDTLPLPDVSESGTYTVLSDPDHAATGSIALTLSADLRVALTADGASAAVTTTRPGQQVRAEFTGSSTSALGIGVTNNTVTKANDVHLIDPRGGTGTFVGRFSASAPAAHYFTALTAGTKYTVLYTPSEAGSGGMTLWLSKPVTTALTTAAPTATPTINRPGQQIELTVPVAVGDGYAVTFTATTLSGGSKIYHLPPGATTDTYLAGLSTAPVDADLLPPLAAGTHRILVRPNEPTTGTTTASLVPDAQGGALAIGGAKAPVSLTKAGQNGRYTFSGAAGQKLTLTWDTPPSSWLLYVTGPDGKRLVDGRYLGTTTLTTDLPALAATGTHVLSVEPGMNTGTFKLALKSVGATVAAPLATGAASEKGTPGAPQEQPATAAVAAKSVPTGSDTWQPGKANLDGRDWVTERGHAPKAPPSPQAPPRTTSLTGRVLKLDGDPLQRVTVTVGAKTARTDAQGWFLLSGIDPRATTLVVDGTSANSSQRAYGRFDIHIQPKAGQSVDLGFPVWMTPLDTRNTVKFAAPATSDVVLTTPQIPGLEVRIPKGSVVRDDKGNPVTELGITAVPIDRPPFPLPTNSVIPVYFTVQPGGTYVFPKGAQIIYPNYTHEAPGTRVSFMDYDPKAKGWYVYGQGAVSADGRQVVPDANTRVWAFHGAMFNIGDWAPWLTSWLKDAVDWLSGDPVELSTGMLTDSHTDLAVSDPRGSAEATRTYWQGDTVKRSFGIGRDLMYNAFLHSEQQYGEVDLYLPGGAKVHFTRTSPGNGWSDAVFEPLDTSSEFKGSKISNVDSRWELRFRDGTVWVFPQYSPLKEIRDRHGNVTKISRLNGNKGEITQVTTPGGRWVGFGYDAQHRITSARDNAGRIVAYAYDAAGRLETVTDPAGKTSRYTYDGTTNRIASATDARGITYMSNTFDANGRVKEQTLAEGQKYTFDHTQTGVGQVTSTTVTEPGGAVRRVEFDAAGYGVKDTQAFGTALARPLTYTRDAATHRINAITDPFGRRVDLQYDANGNITSTTELAGTPKARTSGTSSFDGPYDQPTKTTDALGNTTTYTYDANGNLDTVKDPEGRLTDFDFQPDGQIAKATAPDGSVTEYTYRYGDLVSVKNPEGRTSTRFFDTAGRPTVVTDSAGAAGTLTYDKLNQIRTSTDPLGQKTTLGYDDNGNLTTLTDARDNTTVWEYDQAERPKAATDPLGAKVTFSYDGAGRIARVTNRLGEVATTDHDLLGRTKTTKYGVQISGQAESTVNYEYDSYDRGKTISDTVSGTQSFTYDDYDRPATVTGPTGTVTYSFDNADRRATMTAAGTTTVYGYDTSNILTSVKTGAQNVSFGLDAAGRQKTAVLPGGITRTTDHDKTGNVRSIAYTRGAQNIGDLNYTRDNRGLQTRLSGTLAGVALPATETGAVFGKDNRVTTFNGRSFTYDSEGRLKNDGMRAYAWNTRGQLTGLSNTAGTNAAFGYDPMGTRISKTIDSSTAKYLTDGSNPLVEQTGAGTTTATVATAGIDAFLTRDENGRSQTYLTDALGTVVGLANTDGTVATRYTYDPSGQPAIAGQATTNPYTFTGREKDSTGLLYYRNRYYDPETGRFISQDPIGQAGGANLYQYAAGSPTTYTDPTGNNPLLLGCAAGGLIDGAVDWGMQRLSGRKVNWGQVGRSAATGCAFGMLGSLGTLKWAARAGCPSGNSFTAETPVAMADGTRKPIKNVRIGDQVLAGDPTTRESGPRRVTALIQGSGDKQLVDIAVAGAADPLTATEGHPFWVPDLKRWVPAGELGAGQWLLTGAGTRVQITAVSHRTQQVTVYNLTVDGLHSYYVGVRGADVLVHNSTPGCGPHLALGILHIRGGERNVLANFAERLGAVTYTHKMFGIRPGAAMNSDMVAQMIDAVVSRGGYMSFNMRGIQKVDEMVSGAGTFAGNSVTAMELRYICGNAAALRVTTFFNGPAPC
ncbi:RHS repeat-associated core domain-containing protein [Streptomyces sp. NPDC002602]|uniref:RHS repeat-associated core domain-containing protein n=1 Tax=Streptomyces sp. NPDC002602 TaxID=3364654 RepID=UPI003689D78F